MQTGTYRGITALQRLDARQAENEALLRGAAIHDLGWLRRIAVRGEDRFRWASGMVTNAVETLGVQNGAYNLVLNAQGRIQGDACVWRNGDELEFEITAEQSKTLLAHFDRFIIMDDVELVALTEKSALGLTGPQSDAILAKLGLPTLPEAFTSDSGEAGGIPVQLERGYDALVPHYALWTRREHIPALWDAMLATGATTVGTIALEGFRILEGIPAYGIDIQSRDLLQETSQMRAVSFTKGCYLGQEIVERVRSRGQVHRHLRSVELFQEKPNHWPEAGIELRAAASPDEAKPAGIVTSVADFDLDEKQHFFAIAMMRAEAEIGNHELVYSEGRARILNTPPPFTK